MTSIEDLDKQIDDILKWNDETDVINKEVDYYNELEQERNKTRFLYLIGFAITIAILVALFVYLNTSSDIKSHALAAQNITEYMLSLKVK